MSEIQAAGDRLHKARAVLIAERESFLLSMGASEERYREALGQHAAAFSAFHQAKPRPWFWLGAEAEKIA